MDWAEFRSRREEAPATARVPLCADGEALRQLEAARASVDPDVRALIPDLEERVKAATMQVVVQALPAPEYQDLKDAHRAPPEKIKQGFEWADSFQPALVAASIVSPEMSEADVKEMWATLTLAERATVFLAARDLNETVLDLGFIKPDTE